MTKPYNECAAVFRGFFKIAFATSLMFTLNIDAASGGCLNSWVGSVFGKNKNRVSFDYERFKEIKAGLDEGQFEISRADLAGLESAEAVLATLEHLLNRGQQDGLLNIENLLAKPEKDLTRREKRQLRRAYQLSSKFLERSDSVKLSDSPGLAIEPVEIPGKGDVELLALLHLLNILGGIDREDVADEMLAKIWREGMPRRVVVRIVAGLGDSTLTSSADELGFENRRGLKQGLRRFADNNKLFLSSVWIAAFQAPVSYLLYLFFGPVPWIFTPVRTPGSNYLGAITDEVEFQEAYETGGKVAVAALINQRFGEFLRDRRSRVRPVARPWMARAILRNKIDGAFRWAKAVHAVTLSSLLLGFLAVSSPIWSSPAEVASIDPEQVQRKIVEMDKTEYDAIVDEGWYRAFVRFNSEPDESAWSLALELSKHMPKKTDEDIVEEYATQIESSTHPKFVKAFLKNHYFKEFVFE